MLPRPPKSTLFPYTTLFRSGRLHEDVELLAEPVAHRAVTVMPVVGQRRHADRKSTRLNSSHGYISYAVFCLKKKINPSLKILWFTADVQVMPFTTVVYTTFN